MYIQHKILILIMVFTFNLSSSMKNKLQNLLFILLVVTILSCKKNENTLIPSELTNNGNIEKGFESWFFGFDVAHPKNPNNYTYGFTEEFAASPKNSLKINCNKVTNDTAFCFYSQTIPTTNLRVGSKLTLKVKIKTLNMVGEGISIAIRGDKTGANLQTVFFKTTQGVTQITGNQDFKEYSVSLESYAGDANEIFLFLVYLPKTTGSVYFDDISLTEN